MTNEIASWEIALKSGQIINIKGGWNDKKDPSEDNEVDERLSIVSLNKLVADFESFITEGTSPTLQQRYRYNSSGTTKYGYLYIDVKEIACITQLYG